MSQKLVRAVVRGIDTAPRTTGWVLFGSPEMRIMLLAILPPVGENFTVVWEEWEPEPNPGAQAKNVRGASGVS
jgi:hypothetical protein